jgi:type II secretory ATPase GspE/PulE/Tfp pilus assembly ATPase PilB-like protein
MTSICPTIQEQIDSLPVDDNWGVRTADLLIAAAEAARCSDLHILCHRGEVVSRGRRDGILLPLARIANERRDLLIARLKVMAKLPAFVRQEPQDGRIEWRQPDDAAPSILRVSFLPTIHGENVVIRFPERADTPLHLDSLGMPPDVLAHVQGLLSRQEGTILLTGPSSSGKTTTMYAMLRHLHALQGDRLNFLTIEDPPERDLGFAGQVQVNDLQGLGYERALRAALRQDPNVLMIGEIRDTETARIAVQAGMTGHLIISTLHAGRAARVFSRLMSMGIEPYLVASALTGVVAQRLVRVLCAQCRQPSAQGTYTAAGCDACGGTGYSGRTGLFEASVVTERLRELILAKSAPSDIAAEAAREQTGDLAAQAADKLSRGDISRAEYEYVDSGEGASA